MARTYGWGKRLQLQARKTPGQASWGVEAGTLQQPPLALHLGTPVKIEG